MKDVQFLLLDLDDTLLSVCSLRARFDFILRMLLWWLPYAFPWSTLMALKSLVNATKDARPSNQSIYKRGITAFAKRLRLPEDKVEKLLNQSVIENFKKLEKYFSPMKGAREFVQWGSQKYILYLVTNPVWPPEIVKMRLKWAGLDETLFASYTHSKKMHYCKLQHAFFQEFLQQESLDPAACLMIGNHPYEDGNAEKVGISTFLVAKKNSASCFQALRIMLS